MSKATDTGRVDVSQVMNPYDELKDLPLIERYNTMNTESFIATSTLKELYRAVYLGASGFFHLSSTNGKRIEAEIKKRNRAIDRAESMINS